MVSAAVAARSVAAVERALANPAPVAAVIAREILVDASRRAGGRPTPQARMAAAGLRAQENRIIGPSTTRVSGAGGSTSLGGIFHGAEWGSIRYPQFGGRRKPRGAFLYPVMTETRRGRGPAFAAGQATVDELIAKAV